MIKEACISTPKHMHTHTHTRTHTQTQTHAHTHTNKLVYPRPNTCTHTQTNTHTHTHTQAYRTCNMYRTALTTLPIATTTTNTIMMTMALKGKNYNSIFHRPLTAPQSVSNTQAQVAIVQ